MCTSERVEGDEPTTWPGGYSRCRHVYQMTPLVRHPSAGQTRMEHAAWGYVPFTNWAIGTARATPFTCLSLAACPRPYADHIPPLLSIHLQVPSSLREFVLEGRLPDRTALGLSTRPASTAAIAAAAAAGGLATA